MANPVFDRLGADQDDIEALTAYALYKRHKRKWALDFEAEHGAKPTAGDDTAFARVASTQDQLERYRKDARDILFAFSYQAVQDAKPQIEQDAVSARMERAAVRVEDSGSFRSQVVSGLVSSALTTILLLVLTIGAKVTGVDVVSWIDRFGGEAKVPPSITAPVTATGSE